MHEGACAIGKNFPNLKRNSSKVDNGSVLHLKCLNQTQEMVGESKIRCINGTWLPGIPKCVEKDPIRVDLIVGVPLGIVLLCMTLISISICILQRKKWKSTNEKEDLIDDDSSDSDKRVFNVCDITRRKKMFVRAKDLVSLKQEAAISLNFQAHYIYLRLVWDESGREILSDIQLEENACDTIMVLQTGEAWYPVGNMYDYMDAVQTYDVCSADRRKRVLISADSLEVLLQEGRNRLEYIVYTACLEKDGVPITTDFMLSKTNETIMLLGKSQQWTPRDQRNVFVPAADYHDNRGYIENKETTKKRIFNVWSIDGRKRRSVQAQNLAELHINAARAHGLMNPVEIAVMTSQILITNDRDLDFYKDEILVVQKSVKSYENRDQSSINTNIVTNNGYGNYDSMLPAKDYDHLEVRNSNGGSQIGLYGYNHPDIPELKMDFQAGSHIYTGKPPQQPQQMLHGIYSSHSVDMPMTGISHKAYPNRSSFVGAKRNTKEQREYPLYTGYDELDRGGDYNLERDRDQIGYHYSDDARTPNGNKRGPLSKLFQKSRDDIADYDQRYASHGQKYFPRRSMVITGERQETFSDVLF